MGDGIDGISLFDEREVTTSEHAYPNDVVVALDRVPLTFGGDRAFMSFMTPVMVLYIIGSCVLLIAGARGYVSYIADHGGIVVAIWAIAGGACYYYGSVWHDAKTYRDWFRDEQRLKIAQVEVRMRSAWFRFLDMREGGDGLAVDYRVDDQTRTCILWLGQGPNANVRVEDCIDPECHGTHGMLYLKFEDIVSSLPPEPPAHLRQLVHDGQLSSVTLSYTGQPVLVIHGEHNLMRLSRYLSRPGS